jgi:predicted lipoprotein with Yx(FWY)xxD motif
VRIAALPAIVASIAVVIGVFGGLSHGVQGAEYTVGQQKLKLSPEEALKWPVQTVLANSQGFTLYYYTADTPTRSNCTGGCAKIWLPLISDAPTKDPAILDVYGKVATVHTVHGMQVTFNGHLLYTFTGDKAPAVASGNGRAGKWFAASPALGKW